jgi:hypothetical protein
VNLSATDSHEILIKVVAMGKTTHRFVVSAVGKGGQTYLTNCHDKYELKKWLADHEDDLIMNEVKIIDKKKHPILKLFSLKR